MRGLILFLCGMLFGASLFTVCEILSIAEFFVPIWLMITIISIFIGLILESPEKEEDGKKRKRTKNT